MKKASMPNSVKSLGHIKWYSSGSPRPVKSLSSSIRYDCQICSWSRRPKTILESTFLSVINNPFICKFFKYFTNHRKKTNRAIVFSCKPFPNILKYRDHQWDLPKIWKARLLQTRMEEFSKYVWKFSQGALWHF